MNNRNKRLNNLNKIPDIAGMDHRFFLNESGNLVSHEGMTRNQRRLLRIEAKKIFAQYISICKKIQSSGVGFPVDKIIRSMALEYTNRYASSGINNQPISFNYFEPFCEIKLIKDSFAPYVSILPEVNHLFSSSDFFDFLTSNDSAGFELSDLLNIPESRTFNFTNNGNIDELSFFDASGREYVISGFSIVRRGNSVHWFLVAGEQLTSEEWEILSEDVPNIDIKYVTPWKRLFLEECIKSSDGTIGKPIKLDGTEFSIRTVVAGEFDVINKKHISRSIFKETENMYHVYCDDPDVIISDSQKETESIIDNLMDRISQADILWNIAESFFQIFQYFEMRVTIPKNLLQEGKLLSLKGKGGKGLKADYVVVEAISVENNSAEPSVIRRIKMPVYSIETEGHWRRLKFGQRGKDRDGQPVDGKTWVSRSSPWRNANRRDGVVYIKDCLAIAKARVNEIYSNVNDDNEVNNLNLTGMGELYVLRCSLMEGEVYKVGWTSGTAKDRAKEISSATGVPMSFVVVESWRHDKPKELEVEVHAQLLPYRINNKREFFRLDFDNLRKIIIKTINRVSS